jgi:hypothetical protein
MFLSARWFTQELSRYFVGTENLSTLIDIRRMRHVRPTNHRGNKVINTITISTLVVIYCKEHIITI